MNNTEALQAGLVQELICFDKDATLQSFTVYIKAIYVA